MKKQTKLTFFKGFRDGLPILLGYLSVAFAFGMLGSERGLPVWAPAVISMTSFTGTGQFVGVTLFSSGIALTEITLTILIINIRYMLMSLSLSQKLEEKMTLWQRLLVAFGNTDEIYAVSMQQNDFLNFRYMVGLILASYIGSAASSILPRAIVSALGIAIYAMFVAIVIPPAKKSRPIVIVIAISIVLSCIFRYTPGLNRISSGWVVIICGVSAALFGALRYPNIKPAYTDESDNGERNSDSEIGHHNNTEGSAQ